jgi:hypothetical protein
MCRRCIVMELSSAIILERGLTSNKVKSVPPVIFHTIPVARSMPISNKGDWMAFNAASLALAFPANQ